MNLDWLKAFRSSSSWSDDDFADYSLSKSEILYAWTLSNINGSVINWVIKMLNDPEESDFGIQETWIYKEKNMVRFSDNYSNLEYSCSIDRFLRDLKYLEKINW